MALIVCTECGRKISDTSKHCIHCGAAIESSHEETVTKAPEAKKTPSDYFQLQSGLQIQLEAEFLETDTWAEKYRRKGLELKAFHGLYLGSAIGIWLSATVFYFILRFKNISDEGIANWKAFQVLLVAGIGCLIVFSTLAKIYSVRLKKHDKSHKKYTYMI